MHITKWDVTGVLDSVHGMRGNLARCWEKHANQSIWLPAQREGDLVSVCTMYILDAFTHGHRWMSINK